MADCRDICANCASWLAPNELDTGDLWWRMPWLRAPAHGVHEPNMVPIGICTDILKCSVVRRSNTTWDTSCTRFRSFNEEMQIWVRQQEDLQSN